MIFTGGCLFRSSIRTSSLLLRHHDVRDQQVDVGVLEQLQPSLPSRASITVWPKWTRVSADGADGVVILDEENSSHDQRGGRRKRTVDVNDALSAGHRGTDGIPCPRRAGCGPGRASWFSIMPCATARPNRAAWSMPLPRAGEARLVRTRPSIGARAASCVTQSHHPPLDHEDGASAAAEQQRVDGPDDRMYIKPFLPPNGAAIW